MTALLHAAVTEKRASWERAALFVKKQVHIMMVEKGVENVQNLVAWGKAAGDSPL